MSPFNGLSSAIAGLHWGWKAVGVFASGFVVAVGFLRGPINQNAEAIEITVAAEAEHYAEFCDFRQTMTMYIQTDSARWNRVLCHLEESRKAEPNWTRCER